MKGRLQERFERARAANDQEGIRLYGEVLKGINDQASANAPLVRQAKQFDSDLRQSERQANVGLIVNDIMPAGTKHQTTVANNAAERQMDMVRLLQTGDADRLQGFLGYLDRNRADTLAFNREMAQMNQPSGLGRFASDLTAVAMPFLVGASLLA